MESNYESILSLLEDMEGYLQECNNLIFSSKVVVNMEIIMEFMADLRMKLPEEVKRSRRIIEERDKIIFAAEAEADAIVAKGREEADALIADHAIRQEAIREAQELLNNAKETGEEITNGSYDYVDQLLSQNQQVLGELLERSVKQFTQYEKFLRSQVDLLEENRRAIAIDTEE